MWLQRQQRCKKYVEQMKESRHDTDDIYCEVYILAVACSQEEIGQYPRGPVFRTVPRRCGSVARLSNIKHLRCPTSNPFPPLTVCNAWVLAGHATCHAGRVLPHDSGCGAAYEAAKAGLDPLQVLPRPDGEDRPDQMRTEQRPISTLPLIFLPLIFRLRLTSSSWCSACARIMSSRAWLCAMFAGAGREDEL